MKFLRIIPSLLISKKKLVKGIKFGNHKNAGNPSTTILSLENQGADEIILIDIDSYNKTNYKIDFEFLKKITKECSTPITYGGGINSVEDGLKVIRSGFEKIYINRRLLKDPKIIRELSKSLGSQAIIGGLNLIENIKGKYEIFDDKYRKYEIEDYIRIIQDLGVGEIKITFVDREGTNKGLDLVYIKKLLKGINVSSIFEGGIGDLKHLKDAFNSGIQAIGIGTMIVFKDYNIVKIKKYLKNEGFNVRI